MKKSHCTAVIKSEKDCVRCMEVLKEPSHDPNPQPLLLLAPCFCCSSVSILHSILISLRLSRESLVRALECLLSTPGICSFASSRVSSLGWNETEWNKTRRNRRIISIGAKCKKRSLSRPVKKCSAGGQDSSEMEVLGEETGQLQEGGSQGQGQC